MMWIYSQPFRSNHSLPLGVWDKMMYAKNGIPTIINPKCIPIFLFLSFVSNNQSDA